MTQSEKPDQQSVQDVALIVGGGPGISASCARLFAGSGKRLFRDVVRDLGSPTLVVHNIDGRVPGIFRKGIAEAEPSMALDTLRNSAFSAFLVGQQPECPVVVRGDQ